MIHQAHLHKTTNRTEALKVQAVQARFSFCVASGRDAFLVSYAWAQSPSHRTWLKVVAETSLEASHVGTCPRRFKCRSLQHFSKNGWKRLLTRMCSCGRCQPEILNGM